MITGDAIEEGDLILGLASSGLHSNGFSLVRKILEKDSDTFSAKDLLEPTRIYVKSILKALKIKDDNGDNAIHGMAHITGGGLWENVPRVLPEGVSAEIDCSAWELPPVFQWLKDAGNLKPMDLATTLNTGIGMVVICKPTLRHALKASFEESGERVFEIGKIKKRNASDQNIVFKNIDDAWG